ncbi:MAG TPA: tyrosine-type recombinase/integrase [Longimicrobiaceae bacterium]|nr:tyrosine-type recombinase/integrase [Longimicrobiaceae bacterium]
MGQAAALIHAPIVPLLPPLVELEGGDEHLVRLWLHGKSVCTRDAYRRDVLQFNRFVGVTLREISLEHLQRYADHLEALGLADATRARRISAVKSLLTFGQRTGYLIYNVGAAISVPRIRNRLAERILPEAHVQRILALESDPRDHAMLRLFYATGARVSEICGLQVRDLQPRVDRRSGRDAGQVTLYGKGGKTRAVLVSPDTWAALRPLVEGRAPDDAVFRSRRGGHLHRSQVLRIVRRAARRAGIDLNVSPHWLRHAHASHALDRGAPAHLVRDTLGHASLVTTNQYVHARPDESSGQYLGV